MIIPGRLDSHPGAIFKTRPGWGEDPGRGIALTRNPTKKKLVKAVSSLISFSGKEDPQLLSGRP